MRTYDSGEIYFGGEPGERRMVKGIAIEECDVETPRESSYRLPHPTAGTWILQSDISAIRFSTICLAT